MREVYRKFGSVVRRENDFLVRVDEAGEAIEEKGRFSCQPISGAPPPSAASDAVNDTADAIAKLVRPPLTLERCIVSEGVVFHEFGDKKWNERMRRVHVAITRAPHRILIDLAEFDLEPVRRGCEALARIKDADRKVDAIRLADNVGAALLPSLIGDVRMEQWAAPHDGKGDWIVNMPATAEAPPNWFRPSYRARPSRMWFHLRVSKFGSINHELPEAVALLAPVDGRTLRVLCTEGLRAFAVTMPVNAVLAASPSQDWYPYGAGTFGAELVCM